MYSLQELEDLADDLVGEVRDEGHQELEVEKENEEAGQQLDGEGEAEEIGLRDDAGEDAERYVEQKDSNHKGGGKSNGRDEEIASPLHKKGAACLYMTASKGDDVER